ncbi:MAG: 2-oxo-4-hydroxy-4-carboxy-5-ureidoimidazoline decarboxylase [Alphaproteobacteria bacterium]|jgi:OHCU decarboxylase|nr:MAG: 2-oxo-4-hydroxy-4-carboxy-5-ureidoimidazoline decarboxylase [Alphaproteobacteria bacterium]
MINKINKLSKSEFIKVFANIFENAIWIAEELCNQKPFDNFEALSSKMLNIFETATKEKQLKILNAHPDLANKTKISILTPDSLKEQINAGLDQCTKEEFNEFKKLNNTYKKFGFPFILAVKEKTKIEILNNFRKRVFSDPEIEFDEAVKQVKQIANLRLKELNNKDL